MTAPGLFAEPERVEVPDGLADWPVSRLLAGLFSARKVDDWEAVHRVMVELAKREPYQENPMGRLVAEVLGMHCPDRMYTDCGHCHEEDESGGVPDGAFWLGGLEEYVCEQGYDATVCEACDVDDDSARQGDGTWPCPTFKRLAETMIAALVGVAS